MKLYLATLAIVAAVFSCEAQVPKCSEEVVEEFTKINETLAKRRDLCYGNATETEECDIVGCTLLTLTMNKGLTFEGHCLFNYTNTTTGEQVEENLHDFAFALREKEAAHNLYCFHDEDGKQKDYTQTDEEEKLLEMVSNRKDEKYVTEYPVLEKNGTTEPTAEPTAEPTTEPTAEPTAEPTTA